MAANGDTGVIALDAEIAAICQRHGAALATRKVADFSNVGVELINPWTE
jgi:predicted nucleic acid-binding protein